MSSLVVVRLSLDYFIVSLHNFFELFVRWVHTKLIIVCLEPSIFTIDLFISRSLSVSNQQLQLSLLFSKFNYLLFCHFTHVFLFQFVHFSLSFFISLFFNFFLLPFLKVTHLGFFFFLSFFLK